MGEHAPESPIRGTCLPKNIFFCIYYCVMKLRQKYGQLSLKLTEVGFPNVNLEVSMVL